MTDTWHNRMTVQRPREERRGEPVERVSLPGRVVVAVAKALFLNAPARKQFPNERLPVDWWERVPPRVRKGYVDDAEVALLTAEQEMAK